MLKLDRLSFETGVPMPDETIAANTTWWRDIEIGTSVVVPKYTRDFLQKSFASADWGFRAAALGNGQYRVWRTESKAGESNG